MEKEKEQTEQPIVVTNLTKSFGRQRVLNGLNFSVKRGETVAVLGRSGTGKSVLLKLLIGLQKPDAGCISIEGEEIGTMDSDRLNEIRKKIGFLFQQAALYDSLNVEENVEFPLRRHTSLSDSQRRDKARELLTSVGMERDFEKLPSQISGGMQKRVGLARALALDPTVVLFDEPTSGLDPITAGEIGALIMRLKSERNMTSVFVTHDIHGAKSISDRLVMIDRGSVVIEGSFEDLQKSKDEFVTRFLQEAA